MACFMTTSLNAKTVKELQTLAQETQFEAPARRRRARLSRAAQLHLIDLLSRWSATGLAVIAGAAIFISVAIARDLAMRSVIWMALVFAALWFCRSRRKDFRRGARIASHPFRWRADYSSALAVLSAAFGAGGLLLAPAAPGLAATEIIALSTAAILAAGLAHAAHAKAVAAMTLPGLAFLFAGALRSAGDGALLTVIFITAAAILGLSAAIATRLAREAAQRFPRTQYDRRDVFVDESGDAAPQTATGRAAIA